MIRSAGKETQRVLRYLYQHRQINPSQMARHDRKGTLSHWLLLRLAFFEEALVQNKQKLPPLADPRPAKPNQPKLTDAEAITAFSQEQRCRIKREKAVGASGKRRLVEISSPATVGREGQENYTKRRRQESRLNFQEQNLWDIQQVNDTIIRERGDFKVQPEAAGIPSMGTQMLQPSIQNSPEGTSPSKQALPQT